MSSIPGSKPKPALVRMLRGPSTPPRAVEEIVPDKDLEDKTPPADLSPDQKLIWIETLADAPTGLLKNLDRSVFRAWVVAVDTHIRASKKLQVSLVVTTKKGNIIQSPYVGVMNRAALIMSKLTEQLGFSPTGRARIAAEQSKGKKNPFAQHASQKSTRNRA